MLTTMAIILDPPTIAVWIVVGLVAGFIASRLMLGHGLGLLADVAVGIAGALVGGFLSDYFAVSFTVPGHPIVTQIVVAFLGAVLLLAVMRLLGAGRRRAPILGRGRSHILGRR